MAGWHGMAGGHGMGAALAHRPGACIADTLAVDVMQAAVWAWRSGQQGMPRGPAMGACVRGPLPSSAHFGGAGAPALAH